LLDTPPAQKATADAAAPKKPTADAAKKEESGAAKTTPPKTTTASDSKQQEAAKGRVAGSASNSTKQGSTAPGQAARRGDVGVAGTINPIKAVPFELGHRYATAANAGAMGFTAVLEPVGRHAKKPLGPLHLWG
jgi:hypothetical protein